MNVRFKINPLNPVEGVATDVLIAQARLNLKLFNEFFDKANGISGWGKARLDFYRNFFIGVSPYIDTPVVEQLASLMRGFNPHKESLFARISTVLKSPLIEDVRFYNPSTLGSYEKLFKELCEVKKAEDLVEAIIRGTGWTPLIRSSWDNVIVNTPELYAAHIVRLFTKLDFHIAGIPETTTSNPLPPHLERFLETDVERTARKICAKVHSVAGQLQTIINTFDILNAGHRVREEFEGEMYEIYAAFSEEYLPKGRLVVYNPKTENVRIAQVGDKNE